MAAGDYRPVPELPNRTSPSRGPRGLKKYCEHSVEQAIYRFFASDHEVPDELALDPGCPPETLAGRTEGTTGLTETEPDDKNGTAPGPLSSGAILMRSKCRPEKEFRISDANETSGSFPTQCLI